MIEFINLNKSYDNGRVQAVKNLNFKVNQGEIFGFLGPNGAGKTTTIKMIVGLLKPDSGSILLNGIDNRKDPLSAKRTYGYVPDEPILYEKMTGAKYLSFIADIFEVPDTDREIIKDLAAEFEMTEALNEVISAYSHGMRQKITLMAALIHQPEIFILDEPIVGLDPRSSFVLKERMKKYTEMGKTVFFSTHVMEVAERLCDRVGIINKGEIIALGPFEELRQKAGGSGDTLENLFLELTDENFKTS
ncbi:MAG: ABC transporter ATP-binding protein [Spirochaetia bacterium]